jgi:RNA polymerase sigma factor (TIGR02999 family)
MLAPGSGPVETLLARAAGGDRLAAAELLPLVYDDLRRLARAQMAGQPPGYTLQPTALVHEAYLRVVGGTDPGWNHRGHFFAAAAAAMREILVDQARRHASLKRGGDRQRVELERAEPVFEPPCEALLTVDEALRRLEAEDPRKRALINLRYFAGLSNAETAATLGVSVGTVERQWRYVRAWLKRAIEGPEPVGT